MVGRRRKRTGMVRKILYSTLVVIFLVVISISKFMLDDRLIQVKAKNEAVKIQLEDEKKRTEELENLKLEIQTKKFIEETKLDTTKFKVASLSDNPKTSGQPDLLGIAEYYFNAKGVPSYVSIVSNSITFAGSGNTEKVFESFKKKAFTEPYLYNEIK